jgi:hypothetical protein
VTAGEERELLELVRAIASKLGVSVSTRRAEERASDDEPQLERDDLPVAADGELDRPGGDPVVRVLPRAWKGQDLRNRRMSQCPPLFLGQLGHLLDWRAARNRDEGKDRYALADARDAALARAWRRRHETREQDGSDEYEEVGF